MIELTDIAKRFGKQEVLTGISFSIHTPGIYAILGPNGSGKTTIIKSLLGMVIPDAGEVKVLGKNTKGAFKYRKDISYLPQLAHFPENLKVEEFLSLIETLRGKPQRKEYLIQVFGLKPYLKKTLRHLSGGTRQKVNLVGAMMYDNPILILDEPTNGLDPVALLKLKHFIREEQQKGKVILLTTHVMDLVEELAETLIFLLEGKIYFQGTQADLLDITGSEDLEHAIASILEKQNEYCHAENI